MELLLLAVVAIVWTVIKALSQGPPPKPTPRPRPEGHGAQPVPEIPGTDTRLTGTYFTDQPEETIEVEEVQEGSVDIPDLLAEDNLIRGIVMAEVLSPPRSRRTHGRR